MTFNTMHWIELQLIVAVANLYRQMHWHGQHEWGTFALDAVAVRTSHMHTASLQPRCPKLHTLAVPVA